MGQIQLNSISFGSIQNNIALKLDCFEFAKSACFGSIQNNIALKHLVQILYKRTRFGSIQNNIALKRSDESGSSY